MRALDLVVEVEIAAGVETPDGNVVADGVDEGIAGDEEVPTEEGFAVVVAAADDVRIVTTGGTVDATKTPDT